MLYWPSHPAHWKRLVLLSLASCMEASSFPFLSFPSNATSAIANTTGANANQSTAATQTAKQPDIPADGPILAAHKDIASQRSLKPASTPADEPPQSASVSPSQVSRHVHILFAVHCLLRRSRSFMEFQQTHKGFGWIHDQNKTMGRYSLQRWYYIKIIII